MNDTSNTIVGDLFQYKNTDVKYLQVPDSLQLPVYGFVFMAGMIVGSLFIQSMYKK